MAAGYGQSTALNVIHGESQIPYLTERITQLPHKFCLRLISEGDSNIVNEIENLI